MPRLKSGHGDADPEYARGKRNPSAVASFERAGLQPRRISHRQVGFKALREPSAAKAGRVRSPHGTPEGVPLQNECPESRDLAGLAYREPRSGDIR